MFFHDRRLFHLLLQRRMTVHERLYPLPFQFRCETRFALLRERNLREAAKGEVLKAALPKMVNGLERDLLLVGDGPGKRPQFILMI